MYNKGPFASWVPKPVMLLLIMVILLPLLSISGVYIGNTTDISGAFATYPEYIIMSNYAGFIGMGLAILISMRIKMRFRSKEIVTCCSLLLAMLSLMVGTTDNHIIVVIASLLIGFFKMIAMVEVIMPIMFIISPTGERGRFYSVFYPLSIITSQVSAYFMARLIFSVGWQAPYYVMAIIMLCIAIISLIFQHNQRFGFKYPLYQIDWLSLALLTASSMLFNFTLTFMRQQAWFDSPYIVGSLVLGVLLFILLIYRQRFLKRPMIKFDLFKTRINIIHSIILLFFFGIYLASSSLFTQYSTGVLGYNNLINAEINLWMVPGIILSGVLAFIGFKNKWNIKYYIAGGFVSLFIHVFVLYSIIQPQMSIEYLQIAHLFRGLGMGILFIGIWYYSLVDVTMDDMFGVMSITLMLRSFFMIALGGSLLSWAAYRGQWQSLSDISMYLDSGNIQTSTSMYQNISMNATIASFKTIFGALCWLIVPILIFIITHHYGNFNRRRIILFRKIIRGNSVKGYRLS